MRLCYETIAAPCVYTAKLAIHTVPFAMADYVSYVRQTVTIGAAAVVMVTGTLYLVGAAAGAMAVSTPQGASLTHDVRGGRKRQGTVGAPAPAASSAPKSTTSTGVGAPGSGAAVYETSKAVDEYLLFHYAPVRDRRSTRLTAQARAGRVSLSHV